MRKCTWRDALVFWPYSSCECFGKQISNVKLPKKKKKEREENCIARSTEKQMQEKSEKNQSTILQ